MTKFVLVLTTTLFSLAITAQEPENKFHPLDEDKDGLISIEEAQKDAFLSKNFPLLDVDGDGYLSAEELATEVDIEQ
ncbi:hypothetical protein RS130_15675 [Paraglaciecola aquimarina]|uniref:EF-hand domain-containing protein n=1 Tax=Paraglaciecola aquimarina TaxID=1235557 RepID=A0ABU3SYQ3_9ALTE|nr:hypothetical protein [Paraglaciecola aquimarina]MDU0355150.1 hypothetical protein [Paraglaciecola aquimarina]